MQTPIKVLDIGANVAKDEIVVACSEGSFTARKLANQRTALRAFLKSLPPGSRIGMKSTGIYHELFASLAHKLGFVVFVLNPKDACHYAKGVGMRGKTDRVDANCWLEWSRTNTPSCTPGCRLHLNNARLIDFSNAVPS
jgi:transposase